MYNFVINTDYWDGVAKNNAFNRICDGYGKEEDFWNFQPDIQDWGLTKETIFLDFGCGFGRIVRTVAPKVKEYYGVDVCKDLIEKAKSYHKSYNNVQFFVNNGFDLSIFEDNKFDFTHEFLVFIHLKKEQIIKFIFEIYRVLKPGGIFLLGSLPRSESYVNGFSLSEMQTVLCRFKSIEVKDEGIRYGIKCVK